MGFLRAVGLYLELTRGPRKKAVAARRCSVPPESSEEGGGRLLGQEGRSGGFMSLSWVWQISLSRGWVMEKGRGQEESEAYPRGTGCSM